MTENTNDSTNDSTTPGEMLDALIERMDCVEQRIIDLTDAANTTAARTWALSHRVDGQTAASDPGGPLDRVTMAVDVATHACERVAHLESRMDSLTTRVGATVARVAQIENAFLDVAAVMHRRALKIRDASLGITPPTPGC